MNHYFVRSAVAAALLFTTGAAWAQGTPSIPYPGRVEGTVAEVNQQQQTVTMDDGTLLSATSAQQLSQLQPGRSVAVTFVDDGDRKEIREVAPLAN